jgi:hypothetical protein
MAAIAALVLGTVSTIIGVTNSLISATADKKYCFDPYHNHFTFGPEFTPKIDALVLDPKHGRVGNSKIIISPGSFLPGEGDHEYRVCEDPEEICFRVVKLKKIKVDDTEIYFYIGWVSPFSWGTESIDFFQQKMRENAPDTISVVSIDTSTMTPTPIILTRNYFPARAHQSELIRHIMAAWTPERNFNLKIVLAGPRGSGKTYTGVLLQRAIEDITGATARVYEDFDPSIVGINVKTLVLQHASKHNPVIIMIDEIDTIYDKVGVGIDHDPRLKHTRSTQSFHNMLDSLGNYPYVITLFTTENVDIRQNDKYKSFLRPGRVDFFARMTADTVHMELNV